jgi:hypothetical protein
MSSTSLLESESEAICIAAEPAAFALSTDQREI